MAYTQARVNAALTAANSGITHAQLHTGDPGVAGTSHILAQSTRTELSLSAVSNGESGGVATFTISGATSDITHISLWDADASGTYYGSGELTPVESFAGAGTLEVTITTTASST